MTDRPADDPEQSFSDWARARQQQLLRTAYLLTGDLARAEDLRQDALTKVALRWRRLQHGNPEAYARTIMVRQNISWWRRHRRETLVADAPDAGAGPSVEGADPERRMVLQQALGRLTPRQRAVLVLRFYVDLTEAETAQHLNVSVGTVKRHAHLALQRLRSAAPELADLVTTSGPEENKELSR